jgi:hypothetical protein
MNSTVVLPVFRKCDGNLLQSFISVEVGPRIIVLPISKALCEMNRTIVLSSFRIYDSDLLYYSSAFTIFDSLG